MNKIDIVDRYTSEFRSLMKDTFSTQPDFIHQLRHSAMDRFMELGFPTTRMEDWKDTDVTPITKTLFRRSIANPKEITQHEIEPYFISNTNQVVILNGQFSPEFSSIDLPQKVKIKTLSEVMNNASGNLLPYLGQIANFHDHAFVALNTAFMEDGIFIHIPENQVIQTPIHLLYISKPEESETIYHHRNLILAEANSEATIIEHYIGLGKQNYFTNAVTEVVVHENASIHHIKLQQESELAHHISTIQFHQHRYSTVLTDSISTGGQLTRNDINVVLDGDGCECIMNGLVLAKGNQHVDNHTIIDHIKPLCTSQELYKGIYGEKSHGVFNGRIIVRQNAQKTNASQTNRNVLLSKNALVNSNPQLEIYANDVKCAHASTTGELDEDVIFYLRSRGIDAITAQNMIINGFASEIIDGVLERSFGQVAPVKDHLHQILSDWLSHDYTETAIICDCGQ